MLISICVAYICCCILLDHFLSETKLHPVSVSPVMLCLSCKNKLNHASSRVNTVLKIRFCTVLSYNINNKNLCSLLLQERLSSTFNFLTPLKGILTSVTKFFSCNSQKTTAWQFDMVCTLLWVSLRCSCSARSNPAAACCVVVFLGGV